MKNTPVLFFLVFSLSGCFKENRPIPQITVVQEQFISENPYVCYSDQPGFDNYLFYADTNSDSVQWYYRQNQNTDPVFLGTDDPISIPVEWYNRRIFAYQFIEGDTTILTMEFVRCLRAVYVPIAFTPNGDGINDIWRPTLTFNNQPQPAVYWKIMSQDGIILFETDMIGNSWDGVYKEKLMPTGTYLFYIRLEFENEPRYEESGILSLAG